MKLNDLSIFTNAGHHVCISDWANYVINPSQWYDFWNLNNQWPDGSVRTSPVKSNREYKLYKNIFSEASQHV